MGHWDELCLLCAISPIPPSEIYTDASFGAEDMADRIIEYDPPILSDLQIDKDELEKVLETALDCEVPFNKPEWTWDGFTTCVAIGHFMEDDDTPHELVENESGYTRRIPDGANVETRVVRDPNCGEFSVVVHRVTSKDNKNVEVEEARLSRTSSSNYLYRQLRREDGFGNFFLSEGCFHYLQAWIDLDHTRLGASRPASLSFAGELYEVVNSGKRGRVNGNGILHWMNYDGVENTLDQTQYNFEGGLKLPQYTAASIRNENSPGDILKALIRDCGCWRFLAPDSWPSAPEEIRYTFPKFPVTSTESNSFMLLPNKILFSVLHYVDSLQTYFSLARASKSIHNTLTEDAFLNLLIKTIASSPSGCLFWIRPVSSMAGEVEKAYSALSTFLSTDNDADEKGEQVNSESPFAQINFPWISFVRTCYGSDSMMNRKRIWGQVKQVEEVWREYRIHGWEVDRFGVALK